MSRYSCLIAVYYKDNPAYLELSLNSMIEQTICPDEIVLVEDGPLCDDLYRVIERYKINYPDLLQVISLDQNRGLGNALNCGIKHCRNELVARMDSDDISLPHRCEKQLIEFTKNPSLTIVGTQIYEFIDTADNIVCSRAVPVTYDGILKFSRRRSPFNHPTVMYKKSKVIECGGYCTYNRKEDLDLFIRMLRSGYYAINLPEVLLYYRSSIDNLKRRKTWKNCSEYINIMYKFYRQGHLGCLDMLYVLFGQLFIFLAPKKLLKPLSNSLLRKKV